MKFAIILTLLITFAVCSEEFSAAGDPVYVNPSVERSSSVRKIQNCNS